MQLVHRICDRCKQPLIGYLNAYGTSGFYIMEKTYWCKYKRNNNEKIICENCMWKDEKYLNDYPYMK